MAYDEHLADRIRHSLHQKDVVYHEKRMMGGLTFMVHDKMCVGIIKNEMMARIGKDNYEHALEKPGCREMNFTGKAMKGYVFLAPEAIDMDVDLEAWIDLSLRYNKTLL